MEKKSRYGKIYLINKQEIKIEKVAMKEEKVRDFIVKWLKDYAENAGMNSFVIGISGGIDSAVTSSLCALTGIKTHCITLPIHQKKAQLKRAHIHIDQLQARYEHIEKHEVDLSTVFDRFISTMPKNKNKYSETEKLAQANSRSRLRMMTLYYYAGIHNGLVVGTGNKIEDFGVGFFTKYGDGGVDISPIADLMKSEVYKLAQLLQVDPSIINAPPTDGLWDDDRNDEAQLGATYAELEWAMTEIEKNNPEKDYSIRQKRLIEIYKKHHNNNKHKMTMIPVCEIPQSIR